VLPDGRIDERLHRLHGDFEGTLQDVLCMELKNNFRRAIFIATLNAVMRNLGLIEGSVHCKDRGPEECGLDMVEFLEGCKISRIALVGFQPVHAQCCSGCHELEILDLDKENIGKEKIGVVVLDGDKNAEEVLKWCDLALVTIQHDNTKFLLPNILLIQVQYLKFVTSGATSCMHRLESNQCYP